MIQEYGADFVTTFEGYTFLLLNTKEKHLFFSIVNYFYYLKQSTFLDTVFLVRLLSYFSGR
jgi:hypothetical protein